MVSGVGSVVGWVGVRRKGESEGVKSGECEGGWEVQGDEEERSHGLSTDA